MLYSIFIWIVTWILSSENVKLINFLQRDAKAEILCPERRHFHVTAFPFFSSFLSLSYYLARILLIYGSSFVDCGTWIQLTDCFFASLLSFLQPEQHQEEAVEVILFGRNAGLICHQWDQIGLFLHGLFPTRPLTKVVKYF